MSPQLAVEQSAMFDTRSLRVDNTAQALLDLSAQAAFITVRAARGWLRMQLGIEAPDRDVRGLLEGMVRARLLRRVKASTRRSNVLYFAAPRNAEEV